jgi:hypothetical protein
VTIVTAIGVGPLVWPSGGLILDSSAPAVGAINLWNTMTAGTPLTPSLPAAGSTFAGAQMLIGKDPNDVSANTITLSCAGAETLTDGSTVITLFDGGQSKLLEVVNQNGTLAWTVIGDNDPGLSSGQIKVLVRKQVSSTAVTSILSAFTINTDSVDVQKLTNITAHPFLIGVSGTPYDHQALTLFLTDAGVSTQFVLDGTKFGVVGAIGGLPTMTPAGRRMRMDFFYDAGFSRWILAAVDTTGYAY